MLTFCVRYFIIKMCNVRLKVYNNKERGLDDFNRGISDCNEIFWS